MSAFLSCVGAWVRGLRGGRRAGVAFLAGGLSALAFEPFCLFPLLLFGFAVLVLLIDGAQNDRRPIRGAFCAGWWFAFGQFSIGLHWLGYAFFVDAADHAWQLPFVAVLFPGGLALFVAAMMAVAGWWWRPGASRIFVFACCYGLSEWLRGHLLTGFPWNIAGYGWGASLAVLQSTAVFGVYTLSLLTAWFGAALAEVFSERPRWRLPAVAGALFAVFWIGGTVRLALQPTRFVPHTIVRLVQPDIPQAEKFRRAFVARNWQRLLTLSDAPGALGRPTAVVWPEAAPPFLLTSSPIAMESVADLNARGSLLLTGALRLAYDADDQPQYFNSFHVFARGQVVATYDKFHLVPFAEFLPFEETLASLGLQKFTGIAGSFGHGDGPHTFSVPGIPSVGPLICYEILFPGRVVGASRPDWFVNVTDDSWFGPWAGPRQHLLVAQVRAIEEGIPVLRAANSGISAAIDPFGRILVQSTMNTQTYVDSVLPAKVDNAFFSQFSFLWYWLIVGLFLVVSQLFVRRK